jgi:hypothetical protein
MGTAGAAAGSTYGQSQSDNTSSGSTYGQSGNTSPGSTSGQSGTSSGSTYGQSSTSGQSSDTTAQGSASGMSTDQGNLRTVTGSVAKVDQNSITLDQSAGGMTLTVDSQTQVLRRGQPIAAGISAIKEGTQVRASFDPASNRADKIEVMGKTAKHKHSRSSDSSMNQQPSQNSGSSDTGSNPK